jgi:hypothetical protein
MHTQGAMSSCNINLVESCGCLKSGILLNKFSKKFKYLKFGEKKDFCFFIFFMNNMVRSTPYFVGKVQKGSIPREENQGRRRIITIPD